MASPPLSRRSSPNVLVTGTPGTGKTSLCQELATAAGPVLFCGPRHVNVGDWVKSQGLHEGWDPELDCFVLDEDRLLDAMEPLLGGEEGGCLVDHHSPELFPERWFDLVVVLTAETAPLYSRLEARGYAGRKLQENVEAEIMQVVLEEARESYRRERGWRPVAAFIHSIVMCVQLPFAGFHPQSRVLACAGKGSCWRWRATRSSSRSGTWGPCSPGCVIISCGRRHKT